MAGRITWLFMSFLLEEGKEKGCLPACSVGARRERSLAQSGGWWGCFPPNRDQVEAEIRDAAPRHAAAFLRRISTVVPHRSVIIHDSTSGSGRQPNNLYIANNGAPHLRLLSNPSQAPIQFGIRNEMVRYFAGLRLSGLPAVRRACNALFPRPSNDRRHSETRQKVQKPLFGGSLFLSLRFFLSPVI